jgi:hypothetical protein
MTAPKRPAGGQKKPAAPKKPAAKAIAKPAAKPATKPGAVPAKPPAPAEKAAAPKPVPEKVPPRAQLLPRLHKALKAQYKPVAPNLGRPMLDQVLFACCLENAPADVAEKAFARLMESAFDLNELRVTTVAELAETLHDLPDPARAALSLRRVLQSVFESTYSFSLEHAKKHSLAHGLKTLENIHGVPPFVVNYIASTSLGGHLIPLDRGALAAFYVCGMITQQEYDTGKVPGLERLIGKKAGVEFSSLLHQFGIECLTNLHGATVKKIVQAVNSAAKDRFPKRGEPLPAPVPPPPSGKDIQKSAEDHRPAGPQAAARPAGKTPMPPAGSGPKKPGEGKPGPKPFVVKPNVGKPLTIKPEVAPPPVAEKPPAKKLPAAKPAAPVKRPEAKAAGLSKRKPK